MKIVTYDYSEDLKTLQQLVDAFDEIYFDKFKMRVFLESSSNDYLGRGATQVYTFGAPKNFLPTKYVRNVNASMLWLTSDINPNGITGKDDIARTYTLKLEVMCERRLKYGREWFGTSLIQFYGYGRTIPEILEKFKNFVDSNEVNNLYFK